MVDEPADVDQFVRDTQCLLPRKLLMAISQVRYDSSARFGCCVLTQWPIQGRRLERCAERLLETQKFKREDCPGQPIMVTANDPTRRLFNGDVGVVVRDDRGLRVAFPNSDLPPIDPVSLSEHTTVHAMTIHKSQGSEFDHVVVVLPPEGSRRTRVAVHRSDPCSTTGDSGGFPGVSSHSPLRSERT